MTDNNRNTNRHTKLPIHQYDFDIPPRTHPFATSRLPPIGNTDPTSEFMYQMPVIQGFGKSMSEGGNLTCYGPLDLNALNERLQGLGLKLDKQFESLGNPNIVNQSRPPKASGQSQPYSPSGYERSINQANQLPQAPLTKQAPATNPPTIHTGYPPTPLLDPNEPDSNQPYRWAYRSVTELAPDDSVSMYRPDRAPSRVRSSRRGGTNVDPGENTNIPGEMYDEIHEQQDGESFWTHDDITQGTPKTNRRFEEEMTVGATSVWTRGDIGRDMYDMRDRLLDAEARRDQKAMTCLRRQISEAQGLAATTARLDAAESQLRELQAKLIAEQVARTQIEQEAGLREDEVKNYQNEWACAVRALRRAREEGKKTDEEKRRIQGRFEEARDKLWRYHEALRVREARAQGKEEGRAEAWQEAERWMGGSPPIPGVDPIPAVPGAVLHQTPMTGPLYLQSPQLQSPTANLFQQQQQQQQPLPPQQPISSAQPLPMQSIAQLLEWLANNPGTFSQALGNQDQLQGHQHIHPQQVQVQGMGVLPPQQPFAVQHDGAAGQYVGKAAMSPQMQQMPSQAHQQQQQPTMVTEMMPTTQFQPVGQSSQMQQQMPQQIYHIPGTQQHSQPHQPTSTRSHGKRLYGNIPNAQTDRSSYDNALMADPVLNLPTADSYLERVDHDPGLKKMMAATRSKTVHTSQVPIAVTIELENGRQPLTATKSHFDDNRSDVDKPLPPLKVDIPGVTRSHTFRAAPTDSISSSRRPKRISLSEGLNNYDYHYHRRPMNQIPDGDRYPIFPLPGQNRQNGLGTVEPTNINHVIPLEVSNFQSPNSEYRGGRASEWSTPARHNPGPAASSVRNKVASALRKDMDIEPELENIEEIHERERFTDRRAGQVPAPMEQHGETGMPPHMPFQGGRGPSGPPRPAPSMPNMRHRIQPVMPKPLVHSRARSDSHPGVGRPQSHSIAALHNARQSGDPIIPPHLATAAVSSGVEDVRGRQSALGLSGVGGDDKGSDGIEGMDMGRMRAPTSSRSPSNNLNVAAIPSQVSAQSQISPTTFQPPDSFARATENGDGTHTGRVPISLNTPPGQKGHSNAVDILPSLSVLSSRAKTHPHRISSFNRRSDSRRREPRELQLPDSGSDAQAAHRRARNSHSHTASQPHLPPIVPPIENHTYQPHHAYEAPLPASRSEAPTVYGRMPDNTLTSTGTLKNELRTIDFARDIPLPGRMGTTYDTRTTVVPVFPQKTFSRQPRDRPIASNSGKGNGGNGSSGSGNRVDPRLYVRPLSRSTMKKASTYAASVPPIEEVTEPESGRDTLRRSRVSGTIPS
ncbi:hypothetical protein I305_06004 [Cryptococcus gattii E566]|nr:hypothetical protein I305_06004 [Cryptococcus gattii E566]